MNRFLCLLTMCLTIGVGATFAHQGCCEEQCCGREWEVKADFLYLKPTVDDTYYVIDSPITTTSPNGERKHNDFGFEPGFRVGIAGTICEGRKVELNYSYLKATENDTVSGSFLWATRGRADFASSFENYAGTAQSSLKSFYQNADLRVSQNIWRCGGLNVGFHAGLEWASLHFKEHYTYTTAALIGNVEQKSELWGIGPQLGFALDYDLYTWCGPCPGALTFHSCTSAGLLASKSQTKGDNSTTTVVTPTTTNFLSYNDEDTWRVIPAIHIDAGLNFATTIGCFNTDFRIGYEFNSYIRGMSRAEFTDDVADAQCQTHYYNYDLQGLYVGATVRF